MTILDYYSIFSDAQAITADAASTNIVAVPDNFGYGNRNVLGIYINSDFDALTSLIIKFQSSTDAFASVVVDLPERLDLALADLTEGELYYLMLPQENTGGHIRLFYDVVGTNPTTGSVTCAIQSNPVRWYLENQKVGGSGLSY